MKRHEQRDLDTWNTKSFYPSMESWYEHFHSYQEKRQKGNWFFLKRLQGHLGKDGETFLQAIQTYLEIERDLTKLYGYAHLKKDEDVGHTKHQELFLQIATLYNEFRQEMSWIEPEILQIPDDLLSQFLHNPKAEPYRFYLQKILRFKPHVLSEAEEAILAASTEALSTAERAFEAFNSADLKFLDGVDSEGKRHHLTHGKYLTYLTSEDRMLRKSAFESVHTGFKAWENTLCELVQGEVKKHFFLAKTRRFDSCLQAALFPHHIDTKVYTNLIQTVRQSLPVFHHYFAFRKSVMKLDQLHLYDLKAPLVKPVQATFTFDEAVNQMLSSLEPLGSQYQHILEKGIKIDRWVDRYENERKRTGAYSSGCYDSFPYILLNYHEQFNDMMTLTHEAGHSMHSYFARKNQTYQDAEYPIFLAEVASTFHEELLSHYLLQTCKSAEQKAYIIYQKIEDMRSTFFRQVMFAEFELLIHEAVEKGVPITPAYLNQTYFQLNQDYFGPHVTLDPLISAEWARIPHFYYNFYVYQYATGITAAKAFVKITLKEGPQKYLDFIASGGSQFPIETLQKAGVDMTKQDVIHDAIDEFKNLTQQLQDLL